MNELVRHKTPANQQIARLAHPSKNVLLRDLRNRSRTGQVASAGDLYIVQRGPQAGQYAVDVHLLPREVPPAPRWAVMARNLGFLLLGVAAVFGSLAWLLSTLSAVSLAVACGTVLVAFCAWVWARHGRRRQGVDMEVIARLRVR